MPRPRFNNLSKAKRQRILESSAKVFAAYGYRGASLNQILEDAGISKGAAYYYFDDKADLYYTTLMHYMQELLAGLPLEIETLTAENFWEQVAALYRHQFTQFYERPWVLGITKSGGPEADFTLEALAENDQSPLAEVWGLAEGLTGRLLSRGRELGVVRDDLPDDLLQALMFAVDVAHDRWLFDRWDELSQADLELGALRIADTLRRMMSPG